MTSTARHRQGLRVLPGSWAELADLVLARCCGGCGTTGTRWCARCGRSLTTAPVQSRVLADGLVVWSAVAYDAAARSAVVAWKDDGRADLTGPLAVGLRRAADLALQDSRRAAVVCPVVLVPVPSSSRASRARGHEPVRDLARSAGASLRRRGTPVRVLPVLRQVRRVGDQSTLDSVQRAQNLSGALAVTAGWQARLVGRDVLLVDDVVTTGATLVEAHRALAQTGARVVAAATVASTQLRRRAG